MISATMLIFLICATSGGFPECRIKLDDCVKKEKKRTPVAVEKCMRKFNLVWDIERDRK